MCLGNSSLLLSYKNTLLNFLLKFIILHFSDEAFVPSEDLSLPLLDSSSLLSPTNLKEYIVFYICVELSFLSCCCCFFFFDVDHFQSFHWIHSNTAPALCFGFWFLAARHVGFHSPLHSMTRDQTWTPPSTVSSEVQTTGKEVCQGCILSPCFFNLYAEYIMRNAGLEEAQAGIKIAGRNINNLRYTDDIILMTQSE